MINKHRLENALPGKNGQNYSNNEFRAVKMKIYLIYLIFTGGADYNIAFRGITITF